MGPLPRRAGGAIGQKLQIAVCIFPVVVMLCFIPAAGLLELKRGTHASDAKLNFRTGSRCDVFLQWFISGAQSNSEPEFSAFLKEYLLLLFFFFILLLTPNSTSAVNLAQGRGVFWLGGWILFWFFLVVCFFKINALLIQIYKMSLSKLSLFDIQLYICPASVRYKVGLLSSAAACSGKTYSVFIITFIILPYSVLTLWIGVSPSKLSLVLARSVKSVDQLEFRTDDLLF